MLDNDASAACCSVPAVSSQVNVKKAAHCCMEHIDDLVSDDLLHSREERLKTQRLVSFIGQQSRQQRCNETLQATDSRNISVRQLDRQHYTEE